MSTVAFYTLGCKVNQYETEAMSALFLQAGYQLVPFDGPSDVYVINTCTVTGTSDQKSRQIIRRARRHNPNAVVAVVGCYAQVAPEDIQKIGGVNVILGTADRGKIVEYVQQAKQRTATYVTDALAHREYEELWVTSYHNKARALVKIEEGCNEYCSYCMIPYARGPVRSRPLESIRQEVTALAENGYSEIVLTGIHIASYGRDGIGHTLLDVIHTICQIGGIRRIRLGSLEPRLLTKDFVTKLSSIPQVCPHFHLSLQSGCDSTLQRMNRKYTTAQYRQNVALLRQYYDNPAVTTDIMVGFPGETDQEAQETLDFVEKCGFARIHVFPYSRRKGTAADAMPDQVPEAVKHARAAKLLALGNQLEENFVSTLVGTVQDVLFETAAGEAEAEGYTGQYVRVRAKARPGQLCRVRICAREGTLARGEVLD